MTAALWDCTADEYHSDSRLSCTKLKTFRDDPQLYHGRYVTGEYPFEETPALRFGRLFHEHVLENRKLVVCPASLREPDPWHLQMEYPILIPAEVLSANGAKTGKKWEAFRDENLKAHEQGRLLKAAEFQAIADWRAWHAEHAAELIVTEKELAQVNGMLRGILRNKAAKAILDADGPNERAITWTNAWGINCRMRMDMGRPKLALHRRDVGLFADLKTCQSTHFKAIASALSDYDYDLQWAMYADGIAALTGEEWPCAFIFCEKDEPYTCEVASVGESDCEFAKLGQDKYKRAMEAFCRARDAGIWECEGHGEIRRLTPHRWAAMAGEWEA